MYILFGNSQATTLVHFTLGKKNTYRNFLLYLFFCTPRMRIKYDIDYKYTFKIEKLQLLIMCLYNCKIKNNLFAISLLFFSCVFELLVCA